MAVILVVESELDDVVFTGNADMMSRLWLNLIGNAINYTPENGEIKVILKKNDGKIKVEISDTGVGMTEETLSRIFDQYYQGDTAHSGAGLGLGLPICKRIVELCNGEISVESVPDEGSKFTVTLPV
ncbi:MAG: sensor histidine kinase [Clostridia bacterium]|nr:sensor histidine kinase [Clostridia bacterium]